MIKELTLALKCGCGESTTTKDFHEIAEKCDKCGVQIQVASLFKGELNKPWEKKAEEKPAKPKAKKAKTS